MKAEISFDLLAKEEMAFEEGTYRLPGQDWQVFIFTRAQIDRPRINPQATWPSGATGVHVAFPKAHKLNRAVVREILSSVLGVTEWQETRGPDSMNLR